MQKIFYWACFVVIFGTTALVWKVYFSQKSPTVTTLAGWGFAGFNNGNSEHASFDSPSGVAVDSKGVVYVADYGNNEVREITPDGVVSTVAGSNETRVIGYTGNINMNVPQFSTASFSAPPPLGTPYGIAAVPGGSVVFSVVNHDEMDGITPEGRTVSLFTWSGSVELKDGMGRPLPHHQASGVAADPSGNLYFTDPYYNVIRKRSGDSSLTILAGSEGVTGALDGTGPDARFNQPDGIGMDASGNLYVSDRGNQLIRKISPEGVVSTLAGSGARGFENGKGKDASFKDPKGIAVDVSGNVYVADEGNNAIRKITPGGEVTTLAGNGTLGSKNGKGSSASFANPAGVAVDAQNAVYVADTGNNMIRKIQQY